MIPTALLRFLPHIGIALALLGAVWWIDSNGYDRAEQAAVAREAKAEAAARARQDAMVKVIADELSKIDTNLSDRISSIDNVQRTVIQPIITREIARDSRYTDPAAGISRQLLDNLNAARATSCIATASGGVVCPLPDAGTDR